MEKVSIIIPVFNLEKSIKSCLTTVMNQTYENIEIIILDDGSKDDSFRICKEFEMIDKRIIVYHHDNKGASETRNMGLTYATGNYIMFVDGDDEIEKNMVESYVKSIHESKADVVIGGIRFKSNQDVIKELRPNERVYSLKEFLSLLCDDDTGVFGYISNKLYKKSFIDQYVIRFSKFLTVQEDFDFALQYYNHCSKIYCIEYIGYDYNFVPNKRDVPLDNIIYNKKQLCNLLINNNIDPHKMYISIQKSIFTYYYHLENWVNTKVLDEKLKLKSIPIMLDSKNIEVGFVYFLYKFKLDIVLFMYIKLRKLFVSIIKGGRM